MNSSQIEKNVRKMMESFAPESFVFELLLAYGIPKATVTLLQKGRRNLSKEDDKVILKKKLFFYECEDQDLHIAIDNLQNDPKTMKHNPRFVIVTNYKTLLAVDTKTKETLDTPIEELAKHYAFFLPWAGIEKHKHKNENPADRKAAEKMAKLYDGILAENKVYERGRTHDLNIFLSRLLFCFFAEDTGIFEDGIFTGSVGSHTQADGSDLHEYLDKLFDVLNQKAEDRANLPAYLEKFPYVNGGLFAKKHWIPKFSAKSRRIIMECAELDWAEINPDIFGSMIQAVTHPDERSGLGMHYTSVPNIMKVIEPLFLNDLREEFEKHRDNKKKLLELKERLSKIKFFDPACGSGNFLIITYKEVRKLEMEIIKAMGSFAFSDISLSQFYGIEIDDFAHEIAKLSLYLAEHQMNVWVKKQTDYVQVRDPLPLRETGNIVCGNATRIDWEEVCPKDLFSEIYLMGNPPFEGARKQSVVQKKDLEFIFKKDLNDLDYVSAWYYIGSRYILNTNSKLSLVSTNSICQGQHVGLLWPHVLIDGIEIDFAHTSFKWGNNAKANAGVTCVIVGIRNISNKPKYLFVGVNRKTAKNINPYLIEGDNKIIYKRTKTLSKIPEICFGNMPNDGGNLIISTEEKNKLLNSNPKLEKYIKKLIGSLEFIRGTERYCLWLKGIDLKNRDLNHPFIQERIHKTKEHRLNSKDKGTNKLANRPHEFRDLNETAQEHSIIIPSTSSEKRKYIPMGFIPKDVIISNSAHVIYDAESWLFGIVSSHIHMIWTIAIGGKLETRTRYSKEVVYNTFPIPTLTTKQKEDITRHVYEVLDAREMHPEKTMAQLYDPDKMPEDLREAHHQLDLAVERIYRSKPFSSDEERLEYLFALYERMIAEEKADLFSKTKKK